MSHHYQKTQYSYIIFLSIFWKSCLILNLHFSGEEDCIAQPCKPCTFDKCTGSKRRSSTFRISISITPGVGIPGVILSMLWFKDHQIIFQRISDGLGKSLKMTNS